MNDPQVVALIYSIEHDSTVKYDDGLPIEREEPGFSIKVEDKWVRFEFKTHYGAEDAALKAIGPYIHSWELGAALDGQPGQFGLRFQKSEIVDRNPQQPTTGGFHLSAHAILPALTSQVTLRVTNPKPYPLPPSGVTLNADDPDVLTMYHRYQGYLENREPLPSMASFCLSMLERYLCTGRKKAATKYAIDFKVLDDVGYLAANKGGPETARKAQRAGTGNPLTSEETRFLTQAVREMIRRVAEVAHDPHQRRPQITKADLR